MTVKRFLSVRATFDFKPPEARGDLPSILRCDLRVADGFFTVELSNRRGTPFHPGDSVEVLVGVMFPDVFPAPVTGATYDAYLGSAPIGNVTFLDDGTWRDVDIGYDATKAPWAKYLKPTDRNR